MGRWPHDNQAQLIAFYGEPGPAVERQMVDVIPPFRLYYGTRPVRAIRFHRKAAPALRAAFQKIWDYYGHDQTVIDGLGVQHYDGAYNPRKVRGSATKWSNHAFAGAIDLDAAHNGFGSGHGHMPLPVVAAFKSEGFRWGGDYQHRTDPMHFEACDNGSPVLSFEAWLDHYGCPTQYEADNHPVQHFVDVPEHDPEPDEPDEPAPKSMSTSKIGNTQIISGTVATVAGGAEIAKSALETTSETVSQVNDVATQAGTLVQTTKVVTTTVTDSFWVTLVHALTSPEFIACAVLVVIASTVLTWYWRREHRQAGV